MGKVQTSSPGSPSLARLIQNTTLGTLLFLAISCVTARASYICVEFEAQITGSNMEGWPVNQLMVGYFAYDSSLPPGRQTNSRPMLAFGQPGAMNEFWWYDFAIFNDLKIGNPDPPFGGPLTLDGINLRFAFMCCSPERYGYLSLVSRNTNLFNNDLLPQIFPPLDQFDYGRSIGITREDTQPYGTVSIYIYRLSMVPGSGLGRPVIYDIKHGQAGVSFRFLTEQLTGYRVEFTDSLANVNWQTLTNMASSREPIASIRDAAVQQRFYRVRKSPN